MNNALIIILVVAFSGALLMFYAGWAKRRPKLRERTAMAAVWLLTLELVWVFLTILRPSVGNSHALLGACLVLLSAAGGTKLMRKLPEDQRPGIGLTIALYAVGVLMVMPR